MKKIMENWRKFSSKQSLNEAVMVDGNLLQGDDFNGAELLEFIEKNMNLR